MNRSQFADAFDGLTPRRRQVLKLMLSGWGDRDIAERLHITTATVRKHIENIGLSFGLKNQFPDERRSKRSDLIALFYQYKPEWVTINWGQTESDLKLSEHDHIEKAMDWDYTSICDRDVFILIDRSGSMVRRDEDTATQTRYEYLAEVVEGQIAAILSHRCGERNICDRVFVHFFSHPKTPPRAIAIADAADVWNLFVEHQPQTKTFIAPTLQYCIETWLRQFEITKKGAFFIVYTDGQFDDESEFINCLSSVCNQIENPRQVKFFVLGLGRDVNVEHFLSLDFNLHENLPFNIFVFDLVNEVYDIIELLSRQLTDDPQLAFPDWVRSRHPELVQRILNRHPNS